MANYSRQGTGSKQIENIGKINRKLTQVDCIGGTIRYAFSSENLLLNSDLRETQTTQAITAVSKVGETYTLTLADAGAIRYKETLEVQDSGGDYKDTIVISGISGNYITVSKHLDLIIGDKVVIPADPILQENAIIEVPKAYEYFIYKAESTDVIINFNTNVKKK